MRAKILKDIKVSTGIIRGGKDAHIVKTFENGDILIEYTTCCYGNGMVRIKKGDYEIIRKKSV